MRMRIKLIFEHVNNYMKKSLIYRVREQSISWGYWECKREHRKAPMNKRHMNASQTGTRHQKLYYRQVSGLELDVFQVQVQKQSSRNLGNDVEMTAVGALIQNWPGPVSNIMWVLQDIQEGKTMEVLRRDKVPLRDNRSATCGNCT